ncbi:RNA chaperone Hfq [Halanaerobaculum tunisiense]
MAGQFNLQDKFLNQARREDIQVTIFLVNGVRLSGVIEGFDNFTVVVQTDKGQQLVYKHAISTVVPAKGIDNLFDQE